MRQIEKKLSEQFSFNGGQNQNENILVLGIGNFLMGDEGVGVHFIHELIKQNISFSSTDFLDGGVGGFSLMGYFDEYDHVIIVDATMDGKDPGTISLIKPKFAADFPKALSAHDFGLKDMIESMYFLGRIPEIYLFTISIPSIKPMCIELTDQVEHSISNLISKVDTLIKHINQEI